jgi:hypothetical protein
LLRKLRIHMNQLQSSMRWKYQLLLGVTGVIGLQRSP